MPFKIFASVVAAALLIAFIAPVVIKLKVMSLTVVALIGLTMMVVDIVQSLKSGQD
jgi:hypothetical protein